MKRNTSNKTLYSAVADASGISHRDVKDVVRGVFHFIGEHLAAGKPVNIFGFGTFKLRERKGRTIKFTNNKLIGARTIVQPASNYVKFKPSEILKSKIKSKATQ